MAQSINLVCDWCDILGMPNVPAIRTRVISLDGPQRRIDLCQRCDVTLEPVAELYSRGQDLPSEPVKPAKKSALRSNVDNAPTLEQAEEEVDAEAGKNDLVVICPLPHGRDGAPKRIRYENRGNHAEMVHHHLKMWDIAWDDPDGILTEPCEAHKECLANNIRFTTLRGKKAHMRTCPLEPIDTSD